jgi:hypothetical protein
VPLWVKIFVPFHIIAITSWCLPSTANERPKPKLNTSNPIALITSATQVAEHKLLVGNELYVRDSPIQFYLMTTGFWQYWDMFSPNPASVDTWADEVVHYADGKTRIYQYPRMYKLSIPQKFFSERYRKFFERASDAEYKYLWAPFGQRIALINFDDPKNPPITVDLRTHDMTISPPGKPEDNEYKEETYWTYTVDQVQLRKDKGF